MIRCWRHGCRHQQNPFITAAAATLSSLYLVQTWSSFINKVVAGEGRKEGTLAREAACRHG